MSEIIASPSATAEALARRLHACQLDKAGRPYVSHLERVVGHLLARWPDATEDEIVAAWLHDSIEDGHIRSDQLLDAGIPLEAIAIVQAVTRDRSKSYLDWIGWLAQWRGTSCLRVKIADNMDNSDPVRVAAIPDGHRLLAKRYGPARKILEQALIQGT